MRKMIDTVFGSGWKESLIGFALILFACWDYIKGVENPELSTELLLLGLVLLGVDISKFNKTNKTK